MICGIVPAFSFVVIKLNVCFLDVLCKKNNFAEILHVVGVGFVVVDLKCVSLMEFSLQVMGTFLNTINFGKLSMSTSLPLAFINFVSFWFCYTSIPVQFAGVLI